MSVFTPLTSNETEEFTTLAQHILTTSPTPTYENLPIHLIELDPQYQRDLDQRRVTKLVNEFDPHRFQPIEVSRRADNSLWCIEGQHRLAAAKLLNMATIHALVHTGLTSTDEALLFWLFQRDRRALSAWASFRARLHANEPNATGVHQVCTTLGLRYGLGGAYDIQAITVLETIHKLGGPDLLYTTLTTLMDIWPLSRRRFDGSIMLGLASLLHQHAALPIFDMEHLKETLASATPGYLVAEVRQNHYTYTSKDRLQYGVADLMRQLYNKKTPKARRLPDFKSRDGRKLPGQ